MPEPVVISYPFDATGILQSNRILDEQHSVTENNFRNYYFIVPKFAPFFADNITVVHSYLGNVRQLVENVDYYCALMFVGATRAIGKPIYGAITLNNLGTSGVVSISYNTIGGTWNVDHLFVIEQIAEKAYNPRTVAWEHVVDTPTVFPPIPHAWELVDLVGQTEVVAALGDIEAAILKNATDEWINHSADHDNPHSVTKAQIGLSNVENWTIASVADVLAATSNDTLITPKNLNVKLENFFTKEEVNSILQSFKISIEESQINRAKLYFLAQN